MSVPSVSSARHAFRQHPLLSETRTVVGEAQPEREITEGEMSMRKTLPITPEMIRNKPVRVSVDDENRCLTIKLDLTAKGWKKFEKIREEDDLELHCMIEWEGRWWGEGDD